VRDKQTEEILRQAENMQKESAVSETAELVEELPSAVFDSFGIGGIDQEAGIARYGTQKMYLNILRSYVSHTPGLLEKLRGLSRETLAEYAVTVHGIKGASYGISAEEVGKQAEKLERAAKAGDYDTVSGGNASFIEKTEALVASIQDLLRKTLDQGVEKQKASAPDRILLEKLLDASKRFKPVIMEEVITELESFRYEAGGELVSWLREQLENLEYDAIRDRLETLALV
jgi:HPt (histidine-containing phosphotransfer) domain-containing protein